MRRNIPGQWRGQTHKCHFLRVILLLVELCISVVFTLFIILVFSYSSLVLLFPLSTLDRQAKRRGFHQGPVLQSKFTMTKIVFSYLTSIKLTSVIR